MNHKNHSSDNIPKLRFPEFSDGWEVKKLGEVAEISSGGTPNRAIPYFWNGNIPWVSTTLIDFNTITETNEFITDKGLKNSSAKLFPIGTLLMAMYGQGKTRGKIAVLGIEASTNQACGAIMVNKSVVDYLFIFQNLSKRYDEIRDLSNQGGQENLSGGIIKGIEISFPILPEQQKIATFLSTVDEKLQALKKKKSLLETYKKGVMQRLFCLNDDLFDEDDEYDFEGENKSKQSNKSQKSKLRQIRFKDDEGNDFEDWEVKRLGEIAVFSKGKNISKADIVENGITECIRYGELYTHYGETINQIKSRTNISFDDLVLSEANDIIIPASGETQIDIATASCVLKSGVALGGDLNIIKTKQNGVFMSYYLNNAQKQQIASLAQGISVVHLYSSQLALLEIQLPPLPEQTKIANFLTAIDEKINKVDTQIKQTELWKKGLLQGMFV